MYLVSSEHFRKLTATKSPVQTKAEEEIAAVRLRWVKSFGKTKAKREGQLKDIAKFMKQVLPEPTVQIVK